MGPSDILTITPGVKRAYRLAADDGRSFHTLGDFDTAQDAQVARGAAVWATNRLSELFSKQGA